VNKSRAMVGVSKISVCVATYNGGRYIEEQLLSILAQLSPIDEVVVSDDGSTDGTQDIVSSINDPRVRLVAGASKNLIKNFENALRYAVGDVIFLSDQDDVWVDGRVVRMLGMLSNANCVVGDVVVVGADLSVIHESFFRVNKTKKGLAKNILKNGYLGCAMCFRREVLAAALPFPEKIPMHDWWIGLNAALIGSTVYEPIPVLLYRRHGNNASPTSERSPNSLIKKFLMRFVLFKELVCRHGVARVFIGVFRCS
jgi:glycosyltransferase involved in cell wall biosynthesis